jgi:two-component system response regulator (stage 0 sporulation protein A)
VTEKIRVQDYLIKLGVSPRLSGFNHAVYAIMMYHSGVNITKDIYPQVAELFETTPSRVERSIRHAIENLFHHGDLEELQKVFGNCFSKETGKPTNMGFISMVRLRLDQEKEKLLWDGCSENTKKR